MKAHSFLLFFSLAFILDQVGIIFIPGAIWFMPPAITLLMIFDRNLHGHLWVVLICAFITDVFSGFSFGYTTLSLLGIFFGIVVMRKWVRI